MLFSTRTLVWEILNAYNADLADISGFINSFNGIEDCVIIQLESVVFLIVNGVVIP
jgi:hypothetical protein